MSNQRVMRTLSLKTLLAALPVLAAGPLVLISLWFLSTLWEGGRLVSERSLSQTADALSVAVEREVAGLTRELRLLGDFPLLDAERLAELREQAKQLVARREGWDTIALTDRDGRMLFDTEWPFGKPAPQRDPSHLKLAVQTMEPVVSDLHRDAITRRMAVSVAVPVPRQGEVRWVLEGRVDANSLSKVLAPTMTDTSVALILDRSLQVVASNLASAPIAQQVQAALIEALQSQPEHGVRRLRISDGPILLAAWRRIPVGWTVVVSEPADVRDAPLRYSLARMLAAGAVVLSLGVSISLLLGQRVAAAITSVAADARSLAAGQPVRSRRSAITEISVMFDSLMEAGRLLTLSTHSREKAITALTSSEERLMLAIDATEAGTLDWDMVANHYAASQRARELFGLPPDGPIESGSILQSVHPDDLSRVQAALDAAASGQDEGRVRIDCRVTDRAGAVRWLECRGQVHFMKAQGLTVPTRMVVLVVDQTERQRSVDALHEADRRKDEFLAMLAHELRNPLAPMRNAISLLQRTVVADSQAGQAVAMSARQVSQMTRLVNDLLDVSRITQGKIELRLEDISLSDAVADALEVIRPTATERGLSLVVHQPDPSPVIHADRVRITQIMENLLSNACKYTDAGGCITVDVSQDPDWAIIRVTDTGIGIPANRLTQIFDLFTQVDVAIDRSQGGLGIGLALVRSLVTLHAGTVKALSEGTGKGSTFEVRLPRLMPA